MPPTLPPADLAALRAELAVAAYAGLDDAARAAALQAPTAVPNPAPRGAVPAPLDQGAIVAVLAASPAAIDRMNNYIHLDHVLTNMAAGDRASLGLWFILMTSGTTPIIAADQAATLRDMLTATVPDPAWTATVPGPTPKARLFGARAWTRGDGSIVDFIPIEDVALARS